MCKRMLPHVSDLDDLSLCVYVCVYGLVTKTSNFVIFSETQSKESYLYG